MYAVIETGGKQYRVEVGTELEVELLDVEPGQSITLERVLLVADGAEAAVGTPVVAGAAVEAEVVGKDRGDKVIAFKYRPKARRRVKKGHRQDHTVLRIADIRFNGRSAAATEAKVEDERKTERQRLHEAAARQAAEDAALAAKLALKPAEESGTPAPKKSKAKATVEPVEADVTDAAEADLTEPAVVEPKAPAKRASKPRPKAATSAPVEAAAGDEAAGGDEAAEPGDPAPADETTKATPRKRTRTKKDE